MKIDNTHPRPWRATDGGEVLDANEGTVALTYGEAGHPDVVEQAASAAAHIASTVNAAPDMLEALVEAEAALDMSACGCADDFTCSRCKGLDIAREAIAKATGDSP